MGWIVIVELLFTKSRIFELMHHAQDFGDASRNEEHEAETRARRKQDRTLCETIGCSSQHTFYLAASGGRDASHHRVTRALSGHS